MWFCVNRSPFFRCTSAWDLLAGLSTPSYHYIFNYTLLSPFHFLFLPSLREIPRLFSCRTTDDLKVTAIDQMADSERKCRPAKKAACSRSSEPPSGLHRHAADEESALVLQRVILYVRVWLLCSSSKLLFLLRRSPAATARSSPGLPPSLALCGTPQESSFSSCPSSSLPPPLYLLSPLVLFFLFLPFFFLLILQSTHVENFFFSRWPLTVSLP